MITQDEECGTNPLTSHQDRGRTGLKPLGIFPGDGEPSVDACIVFMARRETASRCGEHPAAAPNEIVRSLLEIINVYQRGI